MHTVWSQKKTWSCTVSAVHSCIEKLKSEVDKLQKRSSGSTDIDSAWCRASHGWATQQLVRFGRLDSEKFWDKETGKIPEHYDSSKMEKLEDDQVGWFDECHKKCHIGHKIAEGKNDEFLVFPRDENGKLDLENGTHSSEKNAE